MISDADKKIVRIVGVTDGVQFGGGQGFTRTRVVKFTVNDTGPYSLTFTLANYTPDNIWRAIGAEIETLRGIGAL